MSSSARSASNRPVGGVLQHLDGSQGKVSAFAEFNDILRERTTSPGAASPELVVLGWNSFSANAGDWFRADGIHVNLATMHGLVPADEHCYEMGDDRSRECRPDKAR